MGRIRNDSDRIPLPCHKADNVARVGHCVHKRVMKYFVTIALILRIATLSSTQTYDAPEPVEPPEIARVTEQFQGIVSAYSSEVEQTDSTPYTTASGQRVRQGIIANNCLDFGTHVEIGGERYEVQDRMNSRYDCSYYDIWFPTRDDAIRYGRQIKNITILHMIDEQKDTFTSAVSELIVVFRDGDETPLTEADVIKLLRLVETEIRNIEDIDEDEQQ